jgi:hypothetical protein
MAECLKDVWISSGLLSLMGKAEEISFRASCYSSEHRNQINN